LRLGQWHPEGQKYLYKIIIQSHEPISNEHIFIAYTYAYAYMYVGKSWISKSYFVRLNGPIERLFTLSR
jgi:hypothetical protein